MRRSAVVVGNATSRRVVYQGGASVRDNTPLLKPPLRQAVYVYFSMII